MKVYASHDEVCSMRSVTTPADMLDIRAPVDYKQLMQLSSLTRSKSSLQPPPLDCPLFVHDEKMDSVPLVTDRIES